MLLAISVLAGCAVVVSTWLYVRRPRWGATVGLLGQVPWAALILLTGAWGLILSWIPMTVVHAWNLVHLCRGGTIRNGVSAGDAQAFYRFRRRCLDQPSLN